MNRSRTLSSMDVTEPNPLPHGLWPPRTTRRTCALPYLPHTVRCTPRTTPTTSSALTSTSSSFTTPRGCLLPRWCLQSRATPNADYQLHLTAPLNPGTNTICPSSRPSTLQPTSTPTTSPQALVQPPVGASLPPKRAQSRCRRSRRQHSLRRAPHLGRMRRRLARGMVPSREGAETGSWATTRSAKA